MGYLIGGKWISDTENSNSMKKFIRKESSYRNWITKKGENGFKAEKGRYHLYVSLACPWAHRTLIMRKMKGLEDIISISILNPIIDDNGWEFKDFDGVIKDPVINANFLHEIYTLSDSNYSGSVTVPVLFDMQKNVIVNNESSDIMRILNSSFNEVGANQENFFPDELSISINKVNDQIYESINNAVYRVGFTTDQVVYEEEVLKLFSSMEKLDKHFACSEYLVPDQLTEADFRLFTTLVRFDSAYYGHFNCNLKSLVSFKNLWSYTKRIYNIREIKETVNFNHIKTHFYKSHKKINPNGIVPVGPIIDWSL